MKSSKQSSHSLVANTTPLSIKAVVGIGLSIIKFTASSSRNNTAIQKLVALVQEARKK